MGKGSSKHPTRYDIQQQQVTGDAKNGDETKQGNNTWKSNRRQDFLNTPDKNDPAKTDDGNSRHQMPVQDEIEGDMDDDPPYVTLDPEDISKIRNNTWKINGRQDFLNAPYKNDPAKTDDGNSRHQMPVQDEIEGDMDDDPPYVTLDPEDISKIRNNTWKINRRKKYLPYLGQDFLNVPDKNDPAKTDDGNIRHQMPVQDKIEGDMDDDPPYVTLDPEDISKIRNNTWKINRRKKYVPYHGQDFLNAPDKNDPEKTDDGNIRHQIPVQDEIEGDMEDDPPYDTLDPEETSKIRNNTWKINRRKKYVPYHGQDSLNVPDKNDPAKTDDGNSRHQMPVQDEIEGDMEDDPPYDTLDPEETSKINMEDDPPYDTLDPEETSKINLEDDPPYDILDPEEISTIDLKDDPPYVTLDPGEISTIAGSQNEERIQDHERQSNKQHDAECRMSTAYLNLTFLREQGHIPKRKKSECEAELASLRRHYRELKRRVCIKSICDHLIRDGVLLEFDLENIMRGSYPRHARVDILLQIMLRKKSPKDFKAFNRALRKTGCEDLADKLENTEVEVPDKPYMREWNSKEVLNAWPTIEEYLIEELQPEYILDFFMQENIFSVDEYEAVFWSLGKRVEMTRTLLETMKKKLPEALFVLLCALEEVNENNNNMVEELEKLFAEGKNGKKAPENSCEKPSNTGVHLVAVQKASFSVTVPLSPPTVSTVRLTVEKEGIVMENVEIEINNYVNNADGACLLRVFLPPTGCEIMKSELGCVTLYLRPHSKYARDKLSMFCQSGGLKDFVLSLMRETDIFSSLPDGEVCINIQVQYQVEELEPEDAKEIKTDLTQSIKDNWSFLCEELDVKALISSSLHKSVLTDEETAEFEGHAATNRHEDADYFLKYLLNKGPAGIQFLMDALTEKQDLKIINRLQKSDPVYRNPKVFKENLIVHFESIVQEIDPSQFIDTFVDRNILDRKFFTNLREKHLRRRCRAALFLKEVLNKGNRAIYALVDVMVDMGYEELVAKLVSLEDNLLESNQQESADHRKEDTVMKVSDVSSREGFTWSCCMKVNVEKKGKDETKQQMSGSSSKNEEPIYMNVLCNDVDEGIDGAEAESLVTLRSKEGLSQTNRPVTHPENSLSDCVESYSDTFMSYPRSRETDEVKKDILSLIIPAPQGVQYDSGIDISISE